MDSCLVLLDNGFFKIVKKEFEIKTGKKIKNDFEYQEINNRLCE